MSNDERRTYEEWGMELGLEFGADGRASAVVKGKRVAKVSEAMIVNAARSIGRVPIGRLMTKAEFEASLDRARNLEIRGR